MPRNLFAPLIVSLALTLVLSFQASSAETTGKAQGPPPMLVSVDAIEQGTAQPLVELVGTVHYVRTARVAGEIAGIVERTMFEEGQRVKEGAPLLQLNTELLETSLTGTRAAYQQLLIELEKARKDLQRINVLFQEDSVAEVVYDENHYRVLGLEKQAESLKATLDRLLLERRKTTILAPFGGLVLDKAVERGEWVAAGGQVALLADDSEIEISVDIPYSLLSLLKEGQQIEIRSGNRQFPGYFSHFVPQGDIATRTFSVKIRLKNETGLVAGMEARAQLPAGAEITGLLVPRDALIRQSGRDLLFLVEEGTAKMIPVTILGYRGLQVAVDGEGLTAGQQVVVKGNERIRDGQVVRLN
ncbi:MAG: efflux RND transporter periplasmic adaptor subunit [Desulfuromonadales bacterium]|nr:efflux RND transporter periplasmic adaptor subunit [Desulfuromonadales bacterium]